MRSSCAIVSLVLALSGTVSAQPTLGISGERFTVNGTAKFLVFVSYFDALRASDAVLDADFAYLRQHGIDGVRIFPNWWLCPTPRTCGGNFGNDTLFDSNAYLRPGRLERLRQVLTKAGQYGLLVDLSFAKETVQGLGSGDYYGFGIDDTAAALAGAYPQVMFDFQNEVSQNRVYRSVPSIDADYLAQLKHYLPDHNRIVFVSTSEAEAELYTYCGSPTSCIGDAPALDVIAPHDARVADWHNRTSQVVSAMLSIGNRRGRKPVYLQEPMPYEDDNPNTNRLEHLFIAVSNAKNAGAAAWTLHTRAGFILRNGQTMHSQLHPDERTFIQGFRNRLASSQSVTALRLVTLKAVQNSTYVVAEGGGGGVVNADRPVAAQWEKFGLIDLNGGDLWTGDLVALRTYNGYYVQAAGGGGGPANAVATAIGPWEIFQIIKLDGGSQIIGPGVWVALKTAYTGNWFMVAEGGGGAGSTVNVNRTAIGPWEIFQINFVGY